jgi:hypothetical protein
MPFVERRFMMGKARLTVFVALMAAGVLAAAAFAATSTSTISLRTTAVGKVLVAANGRHRHQPARVRDRRDVCRYVGHSARDLAAWADRGALVSAPGELEGRESGHWS